MPRVVMTNKESKLLHLDAIKQHPLVYVIDKDAHEMSLAPFWDASAAIGCKNLVIFWHISAGIDPLEESRSIEQEMIIKSTPQV